MYEAKRRGRDCVARAAQSDAANSLNASNVLQKETESAKMKDGRLTTSVD
jgi:hypothetical protein